MINNDEHSIILPGRIVKYYTEDQTADIQISAERLYSNTGEKLGNNKRQLLLDVPVHTPYGGGWSLTFPIKEGDTCMLCFSQIGYDHWFYNDKDTGGTVVGNPAPHLRRQFSEDDGFAMVGFNTKPRAISNYHETSSQWRNSDVAQVISLNDDGSIEILSETSIHLAAPNIDIDADTITMDCKTLQISAATKVNIDANVDITGTLTVGGVEVNDHDHVGDSGGTTGPMQ